MTVLDSSLLVIGAGPYGVAVAAHAKARAIDTAVVGRPMEFWTGNMPEEMFLRSGPDWHLDAGGVHTFENYLEESSISPGEIDPVPISVFLRYAEWFQNRAGVEVRSDLVETLHRRDGRFAAILQDGSEVLADRVVVAPGARYFSVLPRWADRLPAGLGTHTCELVEFEQLSGARVLVVGGRQSAYEWTALLADHGAARVDVVHRHETPRFERVSWKFVDALVDATLQRRGWWRQLDQSERDAIAQQFWEVGRLTLEWWLTPRLKEGVVRSWPGNEVTEVVPQPGGEVEARLTSGETLIADHVVFATGYKPELSNVPYLGGVLDEIELCDGWPVLDDGFQTSLRGLYVTGLAATRDFGPFFGFTKACPAAASIIVEDLLRPS